MTYRMLELVAPTKTVKQAHELVQEEEILASWITSIDKDESILRILLDTDRTESMSDMLGDKFSEVEGFRIMLFEVEATIPYPEEKDEKEKKKEADDEKYVGRVSREELYSDVSRDSELNFGYIGLVILSTLVAVVGLLTNDVIIIIGSMVIAPLLGPNVAMALAATLGDLKLGLRAIKVNAIGLSLVIIISIIMGMIFVVDPEIDQMASRSSVTFSDIVVALSAGSAGVLAFTRGVPAAIVGVMVAVALLPSLVSFGLFLGGGYPRLSVGALILTITNLIGINLAGVTTFLLQGIHPRTWWEEKKAKNTSRWAMIVWIALLVLFAFLIWIWGIYHG